MGNKQVERSSTLSIFNSLKISAFEIKITEKVM